MNEKHTELSLLVEQVIKSPVKARLHSFIDELAGAKPHHKKMMHMWVDDAVYPEDVNVHDEVKKIYDNVTKKESQNESTEEILGEDKPSFDMKEFKLVQRKLFTARERSDRLFREGKHKEAKRHEHEVVEPIEDEYLLLKSKMNENLERLDEEQIQLIAEMVIEMLDRDSD